MKRSMRVSFALVFALFVIPLWFVSDAHAADPQEKTVTVTFTGYNGAVQVECARETRTIYNGISEMIPVPPLSEYPGGWEARGWVASEVATSGYIDPGLVTSLWISDDIAFYGVYERQVELSFVTGDVNVQAPNNVSAPQFVNSSNVNQMYGGQAFLLPSGVNKRGAAFDRWALHSVNGAKYPAESWAFIDLQGAGGATMYAVWKNVYTIHYERLGGRPETIPVDQEKIEGKPIPLSACDPKRDDMVFMGWGRYSNSTEAAYQPGEDFSEDSWLGAGGIITLYPVWHYGITFDTTGGSFDEGVADFWTVKHSGDMSKMRPDEPKKDGFIFLGWHESETAEEPYYFADENIGTEALRRSLYLYAIWRPNTHTVTYDYGTNGGVPKTPEDLTETALAEGEAINLSFWGARDNNWQFAGWSISPEGTEPLSQPYLMPDHDVPLYAIYKKKLTVNFRDGSNTPVSCTEWIYNNQQGENITVPPQSKLPDEYIGWEPLGWSRSEDPDARVELISGSSHELREDNTGETYYGLYQRWITLSYDAAGGEPTPEGAKRTQSVNSFNISEPTKPTFTITSAAVTKGREHLDGWKSDDDSRIYNAGETRQLSENTTMYAMWKCVIKYNGVYGANAPLDQYKTPGEPIDLSDQEPNRSPLVFKGWALTSSDPDPKYLKGHQAFNDDAEFDEGELTLYAVWHSRIIFDGAGGSFDSSFGAELGAERLEDGRPFITRAYHARPKPLPKGAPTWPDHTFQFRGWSQDPDNPNAKMYAEEEDFAELIYGDYMLYAVWEEVVPPLTYTITYKLNNGVNNSGLPNEQIKTAEEPIILNDKPTRSNMFFKGWGLAQDTRDPEYQANQSFNDDYRFNAEGHLDLWAVWHYTITFDPDGGTFGADFEGEMDGVNGNGLYFMTTPHKNNSYATTLPMAQPSRMGQKPVGWSETQGATTAQYPFGATIAGTAFNRNIILYPVWEPITEPPAEGLESVTGTEPLNIFTSDEVFAFDINIQSASVTAAYVNWRITGYFEGEPEKTGTAIIPAGQTKVTVRPLGRMDTGHYVVEAWVPGAEGKERISDNFAVVVPYEQRPQFLNPDFESPFAMDTALAWDTSLNAVGLNDPLLKKSIITDYARAVQLSGVGWIRERMGWQHIDNWSYDASGYDDHIGAYTGRNIKILDMVQGTPSWARSGSNMLPDNLRDIYNFALEAGSRYEDNIHMWEIWNEPESNGETWRGEGADRYAAVLKAASIGFHDSGIPVAMGGLITRDAGDYSDIAQISFVNTYRSYQDALFENGIMDYVEVYNFHNHQKNVDPSQENSGTRAFYNYKNDYDHRMFPVNRNQAHLNLKNSLPGGTRMPAWLTEAGGAIANSPKGLDEHGLGEYDKQRWQARYWVTSAATSLSTGVDKHFWFIGRAQVEDHKPYSNVYWGSFSPISQVTNRMTPYAAYAAQAAMTKALGEALYLGELKADEDSLPASVRGHVFRDNGDTVLILWDAESLSGKTSINLSLPQSEGILTDIMGREQTVFAFDGQFNLDVGPDPIYLKVADTIPAGVYTASYRTRKAPEFKKISEVQRIVLDQNFPAESRSHYVKDAEAYFIQPNEETPVEVTVYNFNETTATVKVSGLFDTDGYAVSEPQTVSLNPFERRSLIFTVNAHSSIDTITGAQLTFTGNVGVEMTSPSVTHVKCRLVFDNLGNPDYVDSCDDTANWGFPGDNNWDVVNGKLVHNDGVPKAVHAYNTGVSLRDGVVSAKIRNMGRQNEGENQTWCGLAVGRSQNGFWWQSGYMAYLQENGDESLLCIYKGAVGADDAGAMPLYKFTTANIMNKEVELTFVMRTEGETTRFDICVDGWHMATFFDDNAPSGYAGPVGYNARISFDDFKVYSVDP
ncbi:MAG: InlB B-repeat-containing protein [Peptococcaceae bacterium]|nr:InlB B-repeat-containing protein [Peptococcaceae bacterium]